MKKISAVALFVFACDLAFAQTSDHKRSLFRLSFISALGTDEKYSAEYPNDYSLKLSGKDISNKQDQLTREGLSSIILNNAKEVQITALSNHVGKSEEGAGWVGLANVNKKAFQNLQMPRLFNTAIDLTGIQIGRSLHIAKNVKGMQLTGLVNIAENNDMSIGHHNILKYEEKEIVATYEGTENMVAPFRSEGRYTYGITGANYNHQIKKNSSAVEAALGDHLAVVKWCRLHTELKATTIGHYYDYESAKAVFNAGYALLPALTSDSILDGRARQVSTIWRQKTETQTIYFRIIRCGKAITLQNYNTSISAIRWMCSLYSTPSPSRLQLTARPHILLIDIGTP